MSRVTTLCRTEDIDKLPDQTPGVWVCLLCSGPAKLSCLTAHPGAILRPVMDEA